MTPDRAESLIDSLLNGVKDENSREDLIKFLRAELDLVGAAARKEERERCAKVCDDLAERLKQNPIISFSYRGIGATMCAKDIRAEQPRNTKKLYWASWYATSPINYSGPWWVSGYVCNEENTLILVAAVKADSEEAAKQLIQNVSNSQVLSWRFCSEKPAGWSPFCDRFPRQPQMHWDE